MIINYRRPLVLKDTRIYFTNRINEPNQELLMNFETNKQTLQDQYIYLFNKQSKFNFFTFMPKQFTITTNTSSGKFNTKILINTSKIISNFIKTNPEETQYHLDIEDEENVISKFERIYQGELVLFNENEIPTIRSITKELNIHCCPQFMKHKSTRRAYNESDLTVKINQITLENFLHKKSLKTFVIQTKKKEYQCNVFGVLSSSILRELISNDSSLNHYNYDIDDEDEKFQLICNFFNFKKIKLSKDNMFFMRDVCADLGINCVLNQIEQFIVESEKVSKTIDDEQNLIDSINEMFDLLFNIEKITVDSVVETIKETRWSETEENVIELAAFILHVAETTYKLHPYLVDLILSLDSESNEIEELKELIPFIVNHLMISLDKIISENIANLLIPFIYQMYKRGVISKEKMTEKLMNCPTINAFFVSWFLPELIETNKFINLDEYKLSSELFKCRRFYYPCDPSNFDEYKRMREKGEYDDYLANSIRNDDIDTFQTIISKSGKKLINGSIKNNMFEAFFNTEIRFLNYAAAYGSIKCFKYLLLNGEKIDESTFKMAIFGGSNEIIRIVDNNQDSMIKTKKTKKNTANKLELIEALSCAIKMHRNDIFDWIVEQKFTKKTKNELFALVIVAIENGNAHALVQLIDNGFNFQNYPDNYQNLLEIASEKGFYLFASLLLKLFNKNSNKPISIQSKSPVCFGSISILKLFEKTMDQFSLDLSLIYAIQNNSIKIIKYFLETLIEKNFILNSTNSIEILINSIHHNSNELLNYVIDKVNNKYPFRSLNVTSIYRLLEESIKAKKIEISIKFADLIYENNPNNYFSNALLLAANLNIKEIVKYIIDKKYRLNYDDFYKIYDFGSYDLEIFLMLMQIAKPGMKKEMTSCLSDAILQKNKPLIKFLLDQNYVQSNSLIQAVISLDLEIVEMVLQKNSKPSFINKCIDNQTALNQAVLNNDMPIFMKLISTPGINPSVYNGRYITPLITAVSLLNVDMFNVIIQFYGDKIKNEKWQIVKALNTIVRKIHYSRDKFKNIHNDYEYDDDSDEDIYDEIKNLPEPKEIEKINQIFQTVLKLNCIDINHRFMQNTLLTYACKINSFDLVENILQYDSVDVNIYDPWNGDTPLIIAIKFYNCEIAQLLLSSPKTDINQKNYDEKSPLMIAVDLEQEDIVSLLLNDERFDPEESNINFAFLSANNLTSEFFLFDSLDVNHIISGNNSDYDSIYMIRNICYKEFLKYYLYTPQLIRAVFKKNYEIVDLIVNHSSFDKTQSHFVIAVQISIFENDTEMLKHLFKINDDILINFNVKNRRNLFIDVLNKTSNEILANCILNTPKFNSEESFIDFEINQNKFTISSNSSLYEFIVNFMLNHGIDPNEPDENGIYLFEEAILNKNAVFSSCLVNSNKVDLNKKIPDKKDESKYTTYLHMVVRSNQRSILSLIIHNAARSFDVNITNDQNETPLMEACRCGSIECVRMLFECENLDYKHRNNRGEDALQIAKNVMKKETKKDGENASEMEETKEINSSEDYFAELLSILNNKPETNVWKW